MRYMIAGLPSRNFLSARTARVAVSLRCHARFRKSTIYRLFSGISVKSLFFFGKKEGDQAALTRPEPQGPSRSDSITRQEAWRRGRAGVDAPDPMDRRGRHESPIQKSNAIFLRIVLPLGSQRMNIRLPNARKYWPGTRGTSGRAARPGRMCRFGPCDSVQNHAFAYLSTKFLVVRFLRSSAMRKQQSHKVFWALLFLCYLEVRSDAICE